MDAQHDPHPDPHGRTLADALDVIDAEHDRIADELLGAPDLPGLAALRSAGIAAADLVERHDDALRRAVQRAGDHAWAVHRDRVEHSGGHVHVPVLRDDPDLGGEHGYLDALRVAYDDAVARRDRDAIAATSRRIVAHRIAHPDADR